MFSSTCPLAYRHKPFTPLLRLCFAWCVVLLLTLAAPARAAITSGVISFGTGHAEDYSTPVSNQNGLSFSDPSNGWLYASPAGGGSLAACTDATGDAIMPFNGGPSSPSTADIRAVTSGDRFNLKGVKIVNRSANTKITFTGYRNPGNLVGSFDLPVTKILSGTCYQHFTFTPAQQAAVANVDWVRVTSDMDYNFMIDDLDVEAVVPAPTVTGLSPTSGPTTGGSSVTIAGTNLAGATAVTFGGANATITGNTPTQITATAPVGSTGSVNVTVTTPGGTSGPATYTYVAAPLANNVSATVAYNSSANPITLNITGGTPTSVAVASGASHGTATASGTSITYTPTTGYSGSDSFTYSATNAGGTSAPATVTITVNPQAPVANAVSATVAANSSNNAITLNITGGTPTSVAVASGASHGTATASGTSITYTPTTGYSGSDSFTYSATNAGGTSAPATVTITVNAAVPGAPTIGTATAGDQQASVTFTAPTDTGSAPITGYEVTVQPGGTKVSGTASPITVPGLTNGQAYTFTVAAKNSAGTGAASAPSNAVTPKMAQTITFAQPASQRLDATPTLAATASSSLAVAFSADAATLAVCEITSGGTLAFHTAGACTIHADQPGDGQYLAAPRVSRTFNVQTAAPGAPTNVVATPGDTQARVAFTAPTDAGTSPITGYTVTVQPGGATVMGTASPIAVPGLTNGMSYTFTVAATNAVGTGAASSPSNSVTPKGVVQGTVPTPTSGAGTTGTATASTAARDPVQDPNCRLAGAQFAGEVPPGYTVSYGSFEFLATGCQHGVTISLTYPQALPYGVRFMKFGPPSFGAPNEWMDWTSKVQLSADRRTVTYSVLDNDAGDSDARVGLIADQIVPAGLSAPGPGGAAAIPTLGEWALALLAALLGLLGWRQGRAKAA